MTVAVKPVTEKAIETAAGSVSQGGREKLLAAEAF